MQEIIVERPYKFVPPHRGDWIPNCLQRFRVVDWYLRRREGIYSYELRGIDYLKESLRQKAGVLIAPNHCRLADPLALGWVTRPLKTHAFAMASWHLFQHPLQSLAIRLCGAFSVNREGIDRQSLDMAIDTLVDGKRPLVLFPEGSVFRSNDRLQPLLDGVTFIARSAARRRAKQGMPPTVIHPIALKYMFRGDAVRSVAPIVEEFESRLAWYLPIRRQSSMLDRVRRLTEAYLASKELEHLGEVGYGDIPQRRIELIDHLLSTAENRWSIPEVSDKTIIPRIKALRLKIVPELIDRNTSKERKQEIRLDLNRIYVAQQIASYPKGYLDEPVTTTRLLESVEQLDEDIRTHARIHSPWHLIIQVGPAIEVQDVRVPKDTPDPILVELDKRLRAMLSELSQEAPTLSSSSTET